MGLQTFWGSTCINKDTANFICLGMNFKPTQINTKQARKS